MKIKIVKNVAHAGKVLHADTMVDLPAKDASVLLDQKFAVEIFAQQQQQQQPPPAPPAPPVEPSKEEAPKAPAAKKEDKK